MRIWFCSQEISEVGYMVPKEDTEKEKHVDLHIYLPLGYVV